MRNSPKPGNACLLALLLPAFAACDFCYTVYRTTPLPEGFSLAAAESVLQQEAGYLPMDSAVWDGETMGYWFERHGGHAQVCVVDGELTVVSSRIGPPDDAELQAWWRLQVELITTLHEHFPQLPAVTQWALHDIYLADRLPPANACEAAR